MAFTLTGRRGRYLDAADVLRDAGAPLSPSELAYFEEFDLIYRSLCSVLYNYVPMSGHPGGSISSGRFVASLLFDGMDYDPRCPNREEADIVSYAAGHKALGLYALWALRDEIMRLAAPDLLPEEASQRLHLEDLLGFRRNPAARAPLATRFDAKPLDGHPTPATPFVKLATGASGVGLGSSIGYAWGARDRFGADAPRVHVVEGEGGLTPGRVAEALAAAGTASLGNVFLHVDWNQSSIDSDRVCRDDGTPGDYVQWNPIELAVLHDWNVVYVAAGHDFSHIMAAQHAAGHFENGQPTAIVYRTVKGWQYGIEGRASHGAGHPLCSAGFRAALEPLVGARPTQLPTCDDADARRCTGDESGGVMEACFWEALRIVRGEVERRDPMVKFFAARLREARERLDRRARAPRVGAPKIEAVYETARTEGGAIPESLALAPGTVTTLRGELGRVLHYYNRKSGGALLISAADLLGSTSVSKGAEGFPPGFYHATANPDSRLLSIGGICEDAMSGVCSGLGAFGHHIGVASSYAAFLAPLGQIAARLHAIGQQARKSVDASPYRPMLLVCAHAGLKTGEDGPTHADPQALQILQSNFPPGTAVTLTPWDPQELWPLVTAALARRPAVIAVFVTRPNEIVPDRAKLGLAPATASRGGLYRLRAPRDSGDGVVVLQESAVTMAFVTEALPRLERHGIDLDVYYVASAELFDAMTAEERERVFPEERSQEAMGITGFTLATMDRWVRSERGRRATLHPYRKGHFLGSGQGPAVLAEAGLDGDAQYKAVKKYLDATVKAR